MPSKVSAPPLRIPIEPFSATAFAPYGTVIQNPTRGATAPTEASLRTTRANQGSATVHHDVSLLTNFYSMAESQKPAKAIMNMFVCAPRKLRAENGKQLFEVPILERHPYTSQTFTPVGLAPEDKNTKYLVIVAPTLPESGASAEALQSAVERHLRPKGPGLPDLSKIKAFLADGSQAVTYAAGTWHSPMAVVGEKTVDFVVMQFSNGVPLDDCQEVLLQKLAGHNEGVVVEIDGSLGLVKARL